MADPGAVSWTASSNGHHGLYRAPWRAGDANHPGGRMPKPKKRSDWEITLR